MLYSDFGYKRFFTVNPVHNPVYDLMLGKFWFYKVWWNQLETHLKREKINSIIIWIYIIKYYQFTWFLGSQIDSNNKFLTPSEILV